LTALAKAGQDKSRTNETIKNNLGSSSQALSSFSFSVFNFIFFFYV